MGEGWLLTQFFICLRMHPSGWACFIRGNLNKSELIHIVIFWTKYSLSCHLIKKLAENFL